MCIAVCPVGALTDRHFGHHPWELDTTETICGFCDVGCTLNVETNRGVVRRVTHLWERGVNHGYTCERGKWGHEQVQHPDRLFYPVVRDKTSGRPRLRSDLGRRDRHRRRDARPLPGGCSSPPSPRRTAPTRRSTRCSCSPARSWAAQHVDRHLTPSQVAVERAVRAALGRDVANTNNMQELFTDVKAGWSSARTSARPSRSPPTGSITRCSTARRSTS